MAHGATVPPRRHHSGDRNSVGAGSTIWVDPHDPHRVRRGRIVTVAPPWERTVRRRPYPQGVSWPPRQCGHARSPSASSCSASSVVRETITEGPVHRTSALPITPARYRGQFVLGDTRFGLTAGTDRDGQSNRHGVERPDRDANGPTGGRGGPRRTDGADHDHSGQPITDTTNDGNSRRGRGPKGRSTRPHECRRRWIIERNDPAPLPAASLLRLLSPLGVSVHAAGRGASKLRRGVGGGRRGVGGLAVVGRGVFGGEMMTGMSTRSQLDYLGFLPPIRH